MRKSRAHAEMSGSAMIRLAVISAIMAGPPKDSSYLGPRRHEVYEIEPAGSPILSCVRVIAITPAYCTHDI
jgi:hypothetical protein